MRKVEEKLRKMRKFTKVEKCSDVRLDEMTVRPKIPDRSFVST